VPFGDNHWVALLQEAEEAMAITGEHVESCLPAHWLIVCDASGASTNPLASPKVGFSATSHSPQEPLARPTQPQIRTNHPTVPAHTLNVYTLRATLDAAFHTSQQPPKASPIHAANSFEAGKPAPRAYPRSDRPYLRVIRLLTLPPPPL